MFDLLDLLLLKRSVPGDDQSLAFRRIDGNPNSSIIYFLPWNTTYSIARQAGFVTLDFLACYEMPSGLVSSNPDVCVQALQGVVEDAQALLAERGVAPQSAVLVGLSVGSYPATYLANRIGARLCAVAPADRADLMIWHSAATRLVRRKAMLKGFQLAHYSRAMHGYHPAQNLIGVGADSLFVFGRRDPFVPSRRSWRMIYAVQEHAPGAQIVRLHAGHFRTLMLSGRYQQLMLGINPPAPRWALREWSGLRQRSPAILDETA